MSELGFVRPRDTLSVTNLVVSRSILSRSGLVTVFVPAAPQETIDNASPSLRSFMTLLNPTAPRTGSLMNGTVLGQFKQIAYAGGGDTYTLSYTGAGGPTSLEFPTNAGQVLFVWYDAWYPLFTV